MHKAIKIGDVWLKASILGSTWAASEILLGSFLHNLRVPFNGHILTAIALILLIAASYKWSDKGLFWRSGLICALMKTMSPSAIIFGPMIAIFMEALLLEFSVRILGRNIAGFILGSALAMSWIMVQKILNFIIFYGFNIVEIYKDLMKYAEKQLHTNFDLVWSPVLILLAAYIVFGMFAVWIGVRIGKNIEKSENEVLHKTQGHNFNFKPGKSGEFPYSVSWLIVDFALLIGMMFVISLTPVYIWAPATSIVIFMWTRRYKRGMRQLSKPKFWIWFVAITMITAFVITAIQGTQNKWIDGLLIGLQMNFRAAIVIIGFSVLGTELYNPKIRNYFAKTSFKQLPVALELAFESLPGVINNLPDVKSFFTQPTAVIKELIFQAEERLHLLRKIASKPIFIVTGNVSEGKTNFIIRLTELLRLKGLTPGGFLSPRILNNDITTGYEIMHIGKNESNPFLSIDDKITKPDIGRFSVNSEVFAIVHQWLEEDAQNSCDLIILDEIGKWELNGQGWKNEIDSLLSDSAIPLLWSVRRNFLPDIINLFEADEAIIFDINKLKPEDAVEIIFEKIAKN